MQLPSRPPYLELEVHPRGGVAGERLLPLPRSGLQVRLDLVTCRVLPAHLVRGGQGAGGPGEAWRVWGLVPCTVGYLGL